MISSITLIILNLLGKTNPDVSLGFLKWYFIGLGIEVVICILSVPKILDKFDEWRAKNEKSNN